MSTTPDSPKSEPHNSAYDVIISGAGPVGLFLACELALAKCAVLILEKADSPRSPLKQLPFGIRGLSAPTIEALDRRGLLNDLEIHKRIKNPHTTAATVPGPKPQRQAGHFAGIPIYENNIDTSQWEYRLPSSTPTSLISEMEELETVLTRRAESLGVLIMRGVALTGFDQTTDGVAVHSDVHTFKCKWLVGCDGSRSAVRKLGGFEFAGTEPEFTGYTTLVDIADPEKLSPGRNVTSSGMYMQSQPGYLLMQDFDGGAFHRSGQPLTVAHVQEVIRRISGTDVTINAVRLATTWTDRARQATAYRNGQVLLAGDAAHIHSPLGGQGLNLGLGDAMNLGWKLAATIHGKAQKDLLDSYYTERHPVGATVLDWSRAQAAIMGLAPHARALYAIVRDLMNTRDGATYFAGRVWGVHTHYLLGGDHPLIGHSVPNFALGHGDTISELMRDGKGILLDFSMNASLKLLVGKYDGVLKYVSGHAKEQFNLSVVLVRPDGVVSWAAEDNPDYTELQKTTDRWFAKNKSKSIN